MREKLKPQGMKVKAKIHDGEIAAIGKKFTQNQVKKKEMCQHQNFCISATMRHDVTRKRSTKRLQHIGNQFRKNPLLKFHS